MATQSTYQENLDVARPGLLVGCDFNADTGICETAAGIGFGLAVGQGSADKGVVLGGALAGFRGISVRDVALGAEVDAYPQYGNVGVITRGKVWVTVAAAVAAGDPVHYVSATGAFTNTGDIGPILGARYVTSAAQDGLAQVELSGYNPN
jgi:hypothetical protein